ncbi:MAG TPA: CHAD domain-containing protein [Roseiflexaceae bacterium]|nr:CHAD domain-containing protein [Roseiflexaceae bacterium]
MVQREHEQTELIAETIRRLPELVVYVFDQTRSAHRLQPEVRRIAWHAALATAAATTQGNGMRQARDLLLDTSIDGLAPREQALAAGAALAQRGKQRMRRDPASLRLSRRERGLVRRLAAILRLSSDLSAGGHCAVMADRQGTIVRLDDPSTVSAATIALWQAAIGPLQLAVLDGDTLPLALGDLPLSDLPQIPHESLQADELLAEGARRQLRRMFERMLAREAGATSGDDIEDVHQMRVAIRRLRASLQVVEPAYDEKLVREFRRALRRLALALGDVRDWDVFAAAVAQYHAQASAEEQPTLEPLATAVDHQRSLARRELLRAFKSDRYKAFKQSFAHFLTTPGAGIRASAPAAAPLLVRNMAGSAIWSRYEQWRAFEPLIETATDAQLHQARIAGKRLRYTLEFFTDILGPKLDAALTPLAELQELLGTMQDETTARERISGLGLANDPGAAGFAAWQVSARNSQAAGLQRAWARVSGATYRRRLWEMITRL